MRLTFTPGQQTWPINNNSKCNKKQIKSMKKIQKTEQEEEEEHDIEILRAVAQAWHGHSSSSKAMATTSEFDAHRQYFKGKPTRFKVEAMRQSTMQATKKDNQSGTTWDFGESLWDSYEIVSVSKKLETGLLLDNPFSALNEKGDGFTRRKESKNSLRNLFNMAPSRRFSEADFPSEGD